MTKKKKITRSKLFFYKLKKQINIKNAIITSIILLTFIITSFISINNYAKAEKYIKEETKILTECEEIKKEISYKTEVINGNKLDDYCEKIAREEYGYAKPGEKVFKSIYD